MDRVNLLAGALVVATVASAAWLLQMPGRLDQPVQPYRAVLETEPAVRVLLVTMWAPSTGYERIQPLLGCLERSLGEGSVELAQRDTYAEGTAVLLSGGAEIGAVCSGATGDPHLRERFEAAFQLRHQHGGVYHSAVIVQASDPAWELADLEGADIAWVDVNSLTGYRAVRAHLRGLGQEPDLYFGRSTFTHGHDRSVQAVRDGVVRVAAVDEEILATMSDLGDLRVVWRSQAFPSPPIVVARGRTDLRDALNAVADDPECFTTLGASGLEETSWSDYDELLEVLESGS